MNQKLTWNVLAGVAAAATAWAGRQAVTAVWSAVTDAEGPVNPADRSISWGEALGWAVLAGITAGLARVLGRRGAAAAWERVTGQAPPGLSTA